MIRILALPVTVIATALAVLAADQLPPNESPDPDSFDIEPPLLKQNLSEEPLHSAGATEADPFDWRSGQAVAKLEKELERAKRTAAGAERLCKIGVLAKVEVEQRLLKVVRCESDVATARLAEAKEQVVAKESQVAAGESNRDDLEAAKAALAQVTEAAQIAAAKRARAELDFAEANLRRQQKLLDLGSAQKSDVTRAEQKLAELKASKD
jgi:hypothetical protein